MSGLKQEKEKKIKRGFWGAFAFYFLIAFEFFYMSSPFAVYFYSVYWPALEFFNNSTSLGWLISFFMPHIVFKTTSVLINSHNVVGALLALIGFIGFLIGAIQVYSNKLRRKGAVTGGIYNWIRHPQYIFFIICSFGLLLLWPRYIVLIMFITMIFAYYLLANAEEIECEAQFGQSYIEYKNKTGMFFPVKFSALNKLPFLPKSKAGKAIGLVVLYIFSLLIGITIAKGLNQLSINSLYASYTDNATYISVNQITKTDFQKLIEIALANDEVKDRINPNNNNSQSKYLNYVLPQEWYVAEIPMNGSGGHNYPKNYNPNNYKIVFTRAILRDKNATGQAIISNVVKREPLIEVWIDLANKKVTRILEMPEKIRYENIPVAVY